MRPVPQASPRGNAISAASGDKRCGAVLTQPTPAKLSGVNRRSPGPVVNPPGATEHQIIHFPTDTLTEVQALSVNVSVAPQVRASRRDRFTDQGHHLRLMMGPIRIGSRGSSPTVRSASPGHIPRRPTGRTSLR